MLSNQVTYFEIKKFTTGVFGIDVHAVQGDIGFRVLRHIDGDRSFAAVISEDIIADDNVHILYGHTGGGILLRFYGDGVGGCGFDVGLDNDRGIVLHCGVVAVGHGLTLCRGSHGDAARCKVIFCRENRHRQAAHQQQRRHSG